jgi:hypothetical protein
VILHGSAPYFFRMGWLSLTRGPRFMDSNG